MLCYTLYMSTRVADIKFDRKKILTRPELYKEEYCQTILELAKRPMNFLEIAVELGVCTETMMEWGRVHEKFSAALVRAKEIHKAWFSDQMKLGLFDSTEKHSKSGVTELKTSRFNAQTAKLYAYISFGITENSVNSKDVNLPTNYADSSIEEKQKILDESVANKNISIAQYDILINSLNKQIERTIALDTQKRLDDLEDSQKEIK